ncbi:hypothetical protein PFUM301598_22580 [Pseudomonas fluorescens]|nr:hypothetical protein A7D21_31785 [Pseudomonas sp. AP19]
MLGVEVPGPIQGDQVDVTHGVDQDGEGVLSEKGTKIDRIQLAHGFFDNPLIHFTQSGQQ